MLKEIYYEYLGTNGIIQSPVHLEDTYYIRKILLIADKNKMLFKEGISSPKKTVLIPEEEVGQWYEIDIGQI